MSALGEIRNIANELKTADPSLKHRDAMSQAGRIYREKYNKPEPTPRRPRAKVKDKSSKSKSSNVINVKIRPMTYGFVNGQTPKYNRPKFGYCKCSDSSDGIRPIQTRTGSKGQRKTKKSNGYNLTVESLLNMPELRKLRNVGKTMK